MQQVPGWLMQEVIAAGMTAYAEDCDRVVSRGQPPAEAPRPLSDAAPDFSGE